MCNLPEKYWILIKPLFYTAFLLYCNNSYSQNTNSNNAGLPFPDKINIISTDNWSIFADSVLNRNFSIIRTEKKDKNNYIVFFDSLKVKASKNPITKKIYDLVVITPVPVENKRITGSSDASYLPYTGKKIRNVLVRQLTVFGSNINNPVQESEKRLDYFLNKTHVNTNEKIIRKNLLFGSGDTISPLLLSDNERILRQLPYINDARIIVVPVSDEEADIIVITRDIYSLGASFSYKGLKSGNVSVFEKNIMGIGHEFGFDIPYDSKKQNSPGIGVHYTADNLWKSFVNLNLFYMDGLGDKEYGLNLKRQLVSSSTKYAAGISVLRKYTKEDLNKSLQVPQPLKFNYQDYWFLRSFLINKESVSRIIIGGRYLVNDIIDRPEIQPDSYYNLTRYRMYLASAAFSIQKYYKTNLIYGYGRTEDIPHGGLIKITAGNEFNEFNNYRKRTYLGSEASFGQSNKFLGYFYFSAGIATFIDGSVSKQGILSLNTKFLSNLLPIGKFRSRNFISVDYTRGVDRNYDEKLRFKTENGFSGFKNDSAGGKQRLIISLESVLFSSANFYNFRFAFFGFSDVSLLSGTNEILRNGTTLSSIGIGIRLRNDNLIFNTFQIRFGFFPNPPAWSKINNFTISGEQQLSPNNFDSGPPEIIPYR
jgi:hypothetical protein